MAAVIAHAHPAEWTRREDLAAHLAKLHDRHWPHSTPSTAELVLIHRVLHEDDGR